MDRQIVRCSQGALYSTIWVKFISLKAVRLGSKRLQRCPVHHKWETVTRVDPNTLSPQQIAEAEQHKDVAIP